MILELVSVIAGIGAMILLMNGTGYMKIGWLVDIPSIFCILILTVPVLFRKGLGKDFLRGFKLLKKSYTCHLGELRRTLDVIEMMQKQVACAGLICMLLAVIYVMSRLDTPETIGPSLAVAVLSLLYAVIFEVLLLPLQIEAKRRIADYMEEEE